MGKVFIKSPRYDFRRLPTGRQFFQPRQGTQKEEKESAGILALAPNSRILYPSSSLSVFFFRKGHGLCRDRLTVIQNGALLRNEEHSIKLRDQEAE